MFAVLNAEFIIGTDLEPDDILFLQMIRAKFPDYRVTAVIGEGPVADKQTVVDRLVRDGAINRFVYGEGSRKRYIPLPAMEGIAHVEPSTEPVDWENAMYVVSIKPPRELLSMPEGTVCKGKFLCTGSFNWRSCWGKDEPDKNAFLVRLRAMFPNGFMAVESFFAVGEMNNISLPKATDLLFVEMRAIWNKFYLVDQLGEPDDHEYKTGSLPKRIKKLGDVIDAACNLLISDDGDDTEKELEDNAYCEDSEIAIESMTNTIAKLREKNKASMEVIRRVQVEMNEQVNSALRSFKVIKQSAYDPYQCVISDALLGWVFIHQDALRERGLLRTVWFDGFKNGYTTLSETSGLFQMETLVADTPADKKWVYEQVTQFSIETVAT
jgi:hypothetical protein